MLPQLRILSALLLISLIGKASSAQIGLGTGLMSGSDADRFNFSSSYSIRPNYTLPWFEFPREDPVLLMFIQPSLRFQGYSFEEPLIPKRKNRRTVFHKDGNPDHIYKDECWKVSNRMSFSYINLTLDPYFSIPLSEQIEPIFVSPGVFAEYQIGGRFKRRFYEAGEERVIKTPYRESPAYFGLNRFQYGVQFELQWKFLTLFLNHSFSPLFKKGEGPDLHRSNAGLIVAILPSSRGPTTY